MSVRRRGNGLTAESYVRLLDVDPRLADHLLVALASANVAAYTTPSAGRPGPTLELHLPTRPLEVVHVDSTRRPAARRVLEATMPDMTVGMPTVEEEDQFAALVAGWDEEPGTTSWPPAENADPTGVDLSDPPRRRKSDRRPVEPSADESPAESTELPPDTSATAEQATDEATGSEARDTVDPVADEEPATGTEIGPDDGTQDAAQDGTPRSRVIRYSGPSLEKRGAPAGDEPSDQLDEDETVEDHYVPPPIPPMPPTHPVTKWGIVALLFGLLLLIAPTLLGLEHTTPVNLLGVLSILGAVGLLVSRLSDRSTDDYDGPDDGAVV